jgi:hypothetical protein
VVVLRGQCLGGVCCLKVVGWLPPFLQATCAVVRCCARLDVAAVLLAPRGAGPNTKNAPVCCREAQVVVEAVADVVAVEQRCQPAALVQRVLQRARDRALARPAQPREPVGVCARRNTDDEELSTLCAPRRAAASCTRAVPREGTHVARATDRLCSPQHAALLAQHVLLLLR